LTAHRVSRVTARTIMNSGGSAAVEVELLLDDEVRGLASSPVALRPGKRERSLIGSLRVGCPVPEAAVVCLDELCRLMDLEDQKSIDCWLISQHRHLGADLMLATSLAYAKAMAKSQGIHLYQYFAELGNFTPGFPGLLVAVLSGGIHQENPVVPFQQVMLSVPPNLPSENIPVVIEAYAEIERRLILAEKFGGYSASSGLLVSGGTWLEGLDVISSTLADLCLNDVLGLAIDVAAEHLWDGDFYNLGGSKMEGGELADLLAKIAIEYKVSLLEDPFAPQHEDLWRSLRHRLAGTAELLGDDLFATSAEYLDPTLANGIVIKMNQVGTIYSTLLAAKAAVAAGMFLCTSHRSLETEDTSVCDLAVGLQASWTKLGGPRRGDRVAKYNRLMRIESMLSAG